jgi:hypothetical protein
MRNRVFGQTPSEDSPKPKVNESGAQRHMSYQPQVEKTSAEPPTAETQNSQSDDEITPVHFKPANPTQNTAVNSSENSNFDALEPQDKAHDIAQADNMEDDLEKQN